MTVNTRAIDLRTVLLHSDGQKQVPQLPYLDVHLGELSRRATSDLLYPESQQLVLELSELLRQVILGPSTRRVSDMAHELVGWTRTWTGARTP